jgi:hypothetical protein
MPIVVQAVPYDVFIDFVRNSKFSPDVWFHPHTPPKY